MLPELKKHFAMFARNDRWGTCVDCPQDGNGDKLPELCQHTSRYDHCLTIDGLAGQFKLWQEKQGVH